MTMTPGRRTACRSSRRRSRRSSCYAPRWTSSERATTSAITLSLALIVRSPPVSSGAPDETALVAEVRAICAGFPAYGYRRVGAELRHRGGVVNGKKLRRILREHGLQPTRRRR